MMRQVSCMLKWSTKSSRQWVYRIHVPYAQHYPIYLNYRTPRKPGLLYQQSMVIQYSRNVCKNSYMVNARYPVNTLLDEEGMQNVTIMHNNLRGVST